MTSNLILIPAQGNQSTTSPRPPQVNPSSGRFRLTISALNSPVTRDGLPTIITSSPGLSDSRSTPDLANWEVPAHSSDQRRMVPLSSGAWTVTKECGFLNTNCTSLPSRVTVLLVSYVALYEWCAKAPVPATRLTVTASKSILPITFSPEDFDKPLR